MSLSSVLALESPKSALTFSRRHVCLHEGCVIASTVSERALSRLP
jgi:hypothetical protein